MVPCAQICFTAFLAYSTTLAPLDAERESTSSSSIQLFVRASVLHSWVAVSHIHPLLHVAVPGCAPRTHPAIPVPRLDHGGRLPWKTCCTPIDGHSSTCDSSDSSHISGGKQLSASAGTSVLLSPCGWLDLLPSPVVCPFPSPCGWLFLVPSPPCCWSVGSSPHFMVDSLVSFQTNEPLFHRKKVVTLVALRNSRKSCPSRCHLFNFKGRCESATFSHENAPEGDRCRKLGRAGSKLRV